MNPILGDRVRLLYRAALFGAMRIEELTVMHEMLCSCFCER
jgi:hypothetical protein